MADFGIEIAVETPGGRTVLRLARPDLLDMDAINEKNEEWRGLIEKVKEGETPPGFFRDINDLLARYVPSLCYTHKIGVIEDGGDLPDADFFLVVGRDVKLTREIVAKRLDIVALMDMFLGIMESVASVSTAVEAETASKAPFRGPSVLERGGPSGGADKPASE